jgi:hypothetical protein
MGALLIVGAAVWGSIGGKSLTPEKIDDQFSRFKGACPEFLGQLQSWSAYS